MLAEGVVAAPMDIDLCLILGAGWPFHNGGITPYLDREGVSERVIGHRFLPRGVAEPDRDRPTCQRLRRPERSETLTSRWACLCASYKLRRLRVVHLGQGLAGGRAATSDGRS